jgi:hypothetical protein
MQPFLISFHLLLRFTRVVNCCRRLLCWQVLGVTGSVV